MPNFHQNRFGNSPFPSLESWHGHFPPSGHAPCSPKQIRNWMFSEIWTCHISPQTDLENHFFWTPNSIFWNLDLHHVLPIWFRNSLVLRPGLAPFPPQQIGNFIFFETQTRPISPQTDWEIPFSFLRSHFPPNGYGNSLLLEAQFNVSGIRTCPISIQTNLEIHFLWNPDMPHSHQNRRASDNSPFSGIQCVSFPPQAVLEIHFLWNRDMLNFPPNTSVNSLCVESGHVPFPPQQMWTFTFPQILTLPISS